MRLSAADIERIRQMPMNFVVGKERSGTTLLQVMLNAHPNISAPPESRFIILLYSRYGSITVWTEESLSAFCNDLFQGGLFRQWKMDKQALLSAFIPVKEHLTYPLLCKCIYYLFAPEGKEVKCLFDKNPLYYYFLPELEDLFPEAKFIHLVRDYRDNIASHQRVFRVKQAADLAYRWVRINKLIDARKHKRKYFTLKYESLVSDAEKSMKEICAFLQLPFDANMSKNHTNSLYSSYTNNESEAFTKIHGSLLQPLSSKHIGEWKQSLLPADVTIIESIAGKYGKTYGYEPSDKQADLNPIKILSIKIRYAIIRYLYRFIMPRFKLYYFVKRKIWKDF